MHRYQLLQPGNHEAIAIFVHLRLLGCSCAVILAYGHSAPDKEGCSSPCRVLWSCPFWIVAMNLEKGRCSFGLNQSHCSLDAGVMCW